MDKLHNLLTPITGAEKIGFIDLSKQSLYGKKLSSYDQS